MLCPAGKIYIKMKTLNQGFCLKMPHSCYITFLNWVSWVMISGIWYMLRKPSGVMAGRCTSWILWNLAWEKHACIAGGARSSRLQVAVGPAVTRDSRAAGLCHYCSFTGMVNAWNSIPMWLPIPVCSVVSGKHIRKCEVLWRKRTFFYQHVGHMWNRVQPVPKYQREIRSLKILQCMKTYFILVWT